MKTLAITIMLLSIFAESQAQLITLEALKKGVIDFTEIKKELILNGFTKLTASPNSDTDSYAYNYDETKETASIRVNITPLIELENAGLYSVDVLTAGDYIHDDLVEEIKENCTFERTGVSDESVYSCDYAIFIVSTQGGNSAIFANPNFQQIPADSPIMEEINKMDMEEINKMDMREMLKIMKEMNEKEMKQLPYFR